LTFFPLVNPGIDILTKTTLNLAKNQTSFPVKVNVFSTRRADFDITFRKKSPPQEQRAIGGKSKPLRSNVGGVNNETRFLKNEHKVPVFRKLLASK